MSGSRCVDKSLVLRDGVRLISRIWLPNCNGPWPALLMRQPYGREIASTITYSHPEWWASKGYMVIYEEANVAPVPTGGQFSNTNGVFDVVGGADRRLKKRKKKVFRR